MTETKAKKSEIKLVPEEMMEAGLHFGHKTSKIHPKIKPYLYGARNGVYIFDLDKTSEKIQEALDFIKDIISQGKTMVLIGTKVQIKGLTGEIGKEAGIPYINDRWLGGTITNFGMIKKRIDYFKELEDKRKSGELSKYTKKERAKFDREIEALEMKFGGIKNLTNTPDAIFVLDMKKDLLAVKEAKLKGIPVIGLADTNIDPTLADYPIPANDDAISSVRFILEKVKEVVLKANAVSLGECSKALDESGGDIDKAKDILRKMGRSLAEKRIEKEAKSGIVYSYLHSNGKVGVMIELRCESDFVANSPDFKNLAHELCLQIAAMKPKFAYPEDIIEEDLAKEKEIYEEQLKESGKPADMIPKIMEGKIEKYKEENSLVTQAWVKDNSKIIKDLFDETVAKLGEKIKIAKFVRYEI